MEKKLILNLPPYIYLTILKQKNNFINLYLYNNTYYINIYQKNISICEYNIETNNLILAKYKPNKNIIYTTKIFNNFVKQLNIYFYFKIKFKGKSFRIRFYKKNKILRFHFGKSHITI